VVCNSIWPSFVASLHTVYHMEQPTDDQVINHVLDKFKKIFPKTYLSVKNAWVTHWDNDPYARGSYTYHPQGSSLKDNSEIARPVGRLCFAGEHTHRCPSNVHGAYLSGLEASKEMVDQLYNILKIVQDSDILF